MRNAEDVECLTSPYFLPDMRMTSLLKLVESGGAHGYMLLYMSLFESASEVMGHSYAILQLTTIGKVLIQLHPTPFTLNLLPLN